MTKAEVISEIEQIVQQPSGTISGTERLDSLDGWDSMAMVEFIAFADERLGLTLSVECLTKCLTVHDLIKNLESVLTG